MALYTGAMKDEDLKVSETLAILRKKIPELSEITLKKWGDDGLIKFHTEKHGLFDWRRYKRSEVMRVLDLLPKERVNGRPLLPRPQKKQ